MKLIVKGKAFLGKREAESPAGERDNRTKICMYSFHEYLLNTFSLMSWFLLEAPSARQALPPMA